MKKKNVLKKLNRRIAAYEETMKRSRPKHHYVKPGSQRAHKQ